MELCQPLRNGQIRFPNGIAFHYGERHSTYERFLDDVERLAARLFAEGIRPGQVIATDIRRPTAHWGVLLALMRLGAVSVSLTQRQEDEIGALPELAAIVGVPGDAPPASAAVRRIEVGANWLRATPEAPPTLPDLAQAEDQVGRICFTSGTSGKPKAIFLDAHLLRRRVSGTAGRTRIHTRSVMWCGLGADTAYGFTATLATWLEGGCVVFVSDREKGFDEVRDRNVNLIVSSPASLHSLLRTAREAPKSRMNGPVIIAGGRLSIPFRDALLERFCTEVLVAFGSSETGGATLGDARRLDQHPGHVGPIFPDVAVDIVGADGASLPVGSVGRIRLRSESAVSSYLNDAEATAAYFRAGWFEPGDLAQVAPDGTLILLGRPADVLNIGGIKLAADEIDAAARGHADIEDACAVALPDPRQGSRLAIAVVGPMAAIDGLPARLRSAIPGLPPFSLISTAAIPRGSMGKINREEYAAELAACLQDPAAQRGRGEFELLGRF